MSSFNSSDGGEEAPWVIVNAGRTQTLYSTAAGTYKVHVAALYNNCIVDHSPYGWLLLLRFQESMTLRFSLFHPATGETILLPELLGAADCFFDGCNGFDGNATLTLPPDDPNCRVVVTNNTIRQIAYRKLWGHDSPKKKKRWGQENPWHVQDYPEGISQFMDHVVCNGVLYATTTTGSLLEIDFDNNDNKLIMRTIAAEGPRPWPGWEDKMRFVLVESGGELLQVVLWHKESVPKTTYMVAVYRLDTTCMNWVRIKTLEGRSIFIDTFYAFSCCGSSFSKPNCVYFIDGYTCTIAFDVGRGLSSYTMRDVVDPWGRLDYFPNLIGFLSSSCAHQLITLSTSASVEVHCSRGEASSKTKRIKNNKDEKEDEEALKLKLPPEIIMEISNYMPWVSGYPWFFYLESYIDTNVKLCDLRCRNTLIKPLPPKSILNCHIWVVSCKEGWLFIGTIKHDPPLRYCFTFYNPFTGEVRGGVPEMVPPPGCGELNIGISAAPTSPNCSIVITWQCPEGKLVLYFKQLRAEQDDWHVFSTTDRHFQIENTPVFIGNKVYFSNNFDCLSALSYIRDDYGGLEFKWQRYKNINRVKKIHGRYEPDVDFDANSLWTNYLVECEGKILSVLVSDLGKLVQVYRLDEEANVWSKVDNLGSHMLFVSPTSCLSSVAKIPEMRNKIYFPRVNAEGRMVFYSLDTHKYHTFDDGEAMDDLFRTSEIHFFGWI